MCGRALSFTPPNPARSQLTDRLIDFVIIFPLFIQSIRSISYRLIPSLYSPLPFALSFLASRMAATTLSRASAIVDSSETSASATAITSSIKQRKVVKAKSTIHDSSASSSSSDESSSDDFVESFVPPIFTVKDLLGELVLLPFNSLLGPSHVPRHISKISRKTWETRRE